MNNRRGFSSSSPLPVAIASHSALHVSRPLLRIGACQFLQHLPRGSQAPSIAVDCRDQAAVYTGKLPLQLRNIAILLALVAGFVHLELLHGFALLASLVVRNEVGFLERPCALWLLAWGWAGRRHVAAVLLLLLLVVLWWSDRSGVVWVVAAQTVLTLGLVVVALVRHGENRLLQFVILMAGLFDMKHGLLLMMIFDSLVVVCLGGVDCEPRSHICSLERARTATAASQSSTTSPKVDPSLRRYHAQTTYTSEKTGWFWRPSPIILPVTYFHLRL